MTTSRPRARRGLVVACTLALTVAACGSDDSSGAATADTAMPSMTGDTMAGDTMAGDTMAGDTAMNMGDPNATPADQVADAVLARGNFELLDTRPQGYDSTAGSAVIARSAAGTTVTIELTGLLPDIDYIAHVHAEPCSPNNGGAHYQFDVGGATTPPNEIHLAFTSDADGHGFMTAENDRVAGGDAQALVVHPTEFLDNKVACVDFVEDEPGSVAAFVDSIG